MRIEEIEFNGFEPFVDGIKFVAPPKSQNSSKAEVHLITGENGTGKTRLLSILAAAIGNEFELRSRLPNFRSGHGGNQYIILTNSTNNNVQTKVITSDKIKKSFCFAYRTVHSMIDAPIMPMGNSVFGEADKWLAFDFVKNIEKEVIQRLGNILTQSGIAVNSDDLTHRSLAISRRINETISRMTGKDFKFNLENNSNELRLRATWNGKKMPLTHLPDGLRAIIKLFGSIISILDSVVPSDGDIFAQSLIILLDEPETNLHPRWQRLVLPSLQSMFPNAQIFCVTHSPFVISSVNEGYVHILRWNDEGKVTIDEPRECSKGDTYRDAVADVLGLDGVMEYDPETQQMLEQFMELKKAIKVDSNLEQLKALAKDIAKRSDRLNYVMGGQIYQLEEQLKLAKGDQA